MTHLTITTVASAKTADLVAFYNSHVESPIKKFRDRTTAIAKVAAILEALEDDISAAEEAELAEAAFPIDDTEAAAPVTDSAATAAAPLTKVLSTEHKASIATSFKLDRETLCIETGEVFPHAGKIWSMYGTDYMTYAQHDKLTRTLYAAAKQGKRAEFFINNKTFVLTAFATDDELDGSEDTGE
jgi:hypothetical protein